MREEQLEVAARLARDFPADDDALFLVGLVYNEQGNHVEAVRYWKKALEREPGRADVHEKLGYAALLREAYEEAAVRFREALRIDPSSFNARLRLGQALLGQGKMREAISTIEKEAKRSPLALRLLAQAYQHVGEYEKARRQYEAAIEAEPGFAEAYYGLASTCVRLGLKEEARRYREKFKALKSEKQEIGRGWRRVFDPLAVTRRSVAHTHTDAGRVYAARGDRRRAEALWRRAAALDPKNAACRLQLASLHQRANEPREALRLYEEVTRIDPRSGLYHLNVGNLRARLEDFEGAERAFRKVIALAPRRFEGYLALAQLHLRAGRNLAEGIRLARIAVQRAPIGPSYYVLGLLYEKSGNRADALRAIERAVQAEPGNAEYRRVARRLRRGG